MTMKKYFFPVVFDCNPFSIGSYKKAVMDFMLHLKFIFHALQSLIGFYMHNRIVIAQRKMIFSLLLFL